MISKKQVQHIAKLARLGLNEKETKKFERDLSNILDYIEKLKEVDVSKTEPMSHPFEVKNVMREDDFKKKESEVNNQELLKLAPETEGGWLKVKSIFK